MPDACDERFAAAMRRLTDLHGEALLYRGPRPIAERAFADGLRVGDAVRRAVRQRRPGRPGESDCAALDAAAERITHALREVAGSEALTRLADAVSQGDGRRVAALARDVFWGLAPGAGRAIHGYRSVPLRRRQRGGEALPVAEDLARRLAETAREGLQPDAATHGRDATPGEVEEPTAIVTAPRPLILAPSLDGCGSEVALRVSLCGVDAPVLLHEDTGDLWIFTSGPVCPVEVALRRDPDDEWWAASPVPYATYVGRLQDALERHGIPAAIEISGPRP